MRERKKNSAWRTTGSGRLVGVRFSPHPPTLPPVVNAQGFPDLSALDGLPLARPNCHAYHVPLVVVSCRVFVGVERVAGEVVKGSRGKNGVQVRRWARPADRSVHCPTWSLGSGGPKAPLLPSEDSVATSASQRVSRRRV
ncbi:hypothetical protein EI94DRAFT_252563 [Lactarius quietus]|nr:hypothetical protein EI94DRAFT_252563 [Lactarius quietus]